MMLPQNKDLEVNLNLNNLKSVQVINMKENRGHARCNAVPD